MRASVRSSKPLPYRPPTRVLVGPWESSTDPYIALTGLSIAYLGYVLASWVLVLIGLVVVVPVFIALED